MALNLFPCKEEWQHSSQCAAKLKQSGRALGGGWVNEHAIAEKEHLSKKKKKKARICLGFILIFKLRFLLCWSSMILLVFVLLLTDSRLSPTDPSLCGKTSKKQKASDKTTSMSLQPRANLLLEEKETVSQGWAAQPSAQVVSDELTKLSSRQPYGYLTLPWPPAGGPAHYKGSKVTGGLTPGQGSQLETFPLEKGRKRRI